MSTLPIVLPESTVPETVTPALPEVHPGAAGGCKVNVPVRIVRYARDGVIVSRDYSGPVDLSKPTVWLPHARITLVDVSCLGHAKCVMPLWLYRQIKSQLAGEPAEAPSSKQAVPEGWESHQCAHCETVVLVRCDTPETPVCRACRRMQTEKAVHEAQCVISDLRKGEPPFDVLTPQERGLELAQLTGAPGPIERQRIELQDEAREATMAREAAEAEQDGERWDAFA